MVSLCGLRPAEGVVCRNVSSDVLLEALGDNFVVGRKKEDS